MFYITLFLSLCLFLFVTNVCSDPVSDYYKEIDETLSDLDMINQLHKLINPHTAISYDDVWKAFQVVDNNNSRCDKPEDITSPYDQFCWTADQVDIYTYIIYIISFIYSVSMLPVCLMIYHTYIKYQLFVQFPYVLCYYDVYQAMR